MSRKDKRGFAGLQIGLGQGDCAKLGGVRWVKEDEEAGDGSTGGSGSLMG